MQHILVSIIIFLNNLMYYLTHLINWTGFNKDPAGLVFLLLDGFEKANNVICFLLYLNYHIISIY